MSDDSHEDISINFSDIDRILDESDREKEGKRSQGLKMRTSSTLITTKKT